MADISSLQSVQSNHEKYKDLFKNSGKNDTISTDTFFSLLMAEMSNQDPLEPTSNTEFVSQMAQFTALQAQQDNLKYSMSNYAAGLVGKTLTMNAQSDDGTLLSGVCTGVNISGSDVKVVVDGKQYDLSAVKAISDTVSKGTLHTMTEALGYVGKEVTVKVLGDDGKFYYAKGKVESEEMQDGDAKIVIDNYLYSIDEIVHVSEGTGSTADKNTEAPAGSAEGNK